jgi:hypothetical protein
MSPKKSKKFDKTAAVEFFVNFCAIFSLVLIVGLMAISESFGPTSKGMASLSGVLVSDAKCSCPAPVDCGFAPIAPAVLFPASADQPLEAALEVLVDDGGFSSRELNLSLSSSRTLRISNRGVRNHSLVIDALNLNSGVIAPGQSVTVILENSGDQARELSFYSGLPGDSGDNFSGVILLE